jgi:glycosyl-4,4'-diaponeurosporenoate acyltransferase
MIVTVPDGWAVALSSVTWFLVSFLAGWWASTWSPARLAAPGPFTRLRDWEEDGRWWERHLRVRRWKDRVPEAGSLFAGGVSKRLMPSGSTEDLERFRLETVRAERVHWLILASTPVQFIWCRPAIAAGMVLFGLAFNVPFIVIQRTNRGRIDRVLARRAQHLTS